MKFLGTCSPRHSCARGVENVRSFWVTGPDRVTLPARHAASAFVSHCGKLTHGSFRKAWQVPSETHAGKTHSYKSTNSVSSPPTGLTVCEAPLRDKKKKVAPLCDSKLVVCKDWPLGVQEKSLLGLGHLCARGRGSPCNSEGNIHRIAVHLCHRVETGMTNLCLQENTESKGTQLVRKTPRHQVHVVFARLCFCYAHRIGPLSSASALSRLIKVLHHWRAADHLDNLLPQLPFETLNTFITS